MSTPRNHSTTVLCAAQGEDTITITKYGTSGLTFTYGNAGQSVNKTTKDAYGQNAVPSFIIFELQAGGGGGAGGGGTTIGNSLDGQNGGGGAGGGFACGILKLDFNTYKSYLIEIGGGGAGGDGSDKLHIAVRDGKQGGNTVLYGVLSDGTKKALAGTAGGPGGICCNKAG